MKIFALTMLGCLCEAVAQTPRFEVASIRQRVGPISRMNTITAAGPRFNAEACSVFELIMYAYNLKNHQVSFPAAFKDFDIRYDILAKAEGDATPTKDELRRMVQSLLADRFKLKAHPGTKEMAVYTLVIGKNGPKLKESAPDTARSWYAAVKGRNYQVTMRNTSIDDIRTAIVNAFLDRPVVDKTGLTGAYDAVLTYTPNLRSNSGADPELNDISIFTAVQEQLGLKLEPQKDIVEMLVVDQLEKPTDN